MKAKVHTGDDMPKEFREKTDLAHALADKLLCIIESEGLADYDIGINALAHASLGPFRLSVIIRTMPPRRSPVLS